MNIKLLVCITCLAFAAAAHAQLQPVIPKDKRGRIDAERKGFHDAANIRTEFWNFGMVGNYPADPIGVDLSVFHSAEVPKGSGLNYSDGITPFVLAKVQERNGRIAHIMETGFRERQDTSPLTNRVMRFEPRPGFFQADPSINRGRSLAVSNDPRTWPNAWPDKANDPDDPGWSNSWNGYFGKRPAADQESFMVLDDDFYDAWDYYPDSRDSTRRGLGLRIEVRGFQWANPQSGNVIFWHYDITNEGTTDYNENIIFGLYMDSGVGGSSISCDGVAESDDDNAFYTKRGDLNLVYTWDKGGRGAALGTNCYPTGYLGYGYLETPGKPFDGIDNDNDGIIDEMRDAGPGQLITGQDQIKAYFLAHYNQANFERAHNGTVETRSAYRAGRWWTGDEDFDWVAELHDAGKDGVFGTKDTGEGDGIPTEGETNFDRTDLHESDQIGLTGFKFNRIRAGAGNPNTNVENIVFYDEGKQWPKKLYDKFTHPDSAHYDPPLALNYNIGFVFASGPFTLKAGKTERFSLALAYGADLEELENTVQIVQLIYNANYQFAVPPPMPTVTAEAGDGYVRLSWDDQAERGIDPVTLENDFEGYRIYRATDPEFRDPKVIITGRGTGPIGNGKPIAQFDLIDNKKNFSPQTVEGVAYYLGNNSGLAHTFIDTTVTNGQLYYYAVTSYDFGSDSLGFYPSENSIAVSRTPRGGTILPKNVVSVRPNPKVNGFTKATASNTEHAAGRGTGTVNVQVVNSTLVPDNHTFNVKFRSLFADSVRAQVFDLVDVTANDTLFSNGYDLEGKGSGLVGMGLLPIANTPKTVTVSPTSGFTSSSPTNGRLKVTYRNPLPINLKRPGFPDNMTITFSDVPIDTSLRGFGLLRSRPSKFRIHTHTPSGDMRMKFYFLDKDNNNALNLPFPDEFIDVVTYRPNDTRAYETWRVELDTTGQAQRGALKIPTNGDVYQLKLVYPFEHGEIYSFTTTAEFVNPAAAQTLASQEPYVVPNPYVGLASFESERFAVSGRGERRMEFRNLPQNATVRIFTVRGELVQTLQHDGSDFGFVAWDMRSKDNLEVAPGLYLYHVDAGTLGTHIGKFAIIK